MSDLLFPTFERPTASHRAQAPITGNPLLDRVGTVATEARLASQEIPDFLRPSDGGLSADADYQTGRKAAESLVAGAHATANRLQGELEFQATEAISQGVFGEVTQNVGALTSAIVEKTPLIGKLRRATNEILVGITANILGADMTQAAQLIQAKRENGQLQPGDALRYPNEETLKLTKSSADSEQRARDRQIAEMKSRVLLARLSQAVAAADFPDDADDAKADEEKDGYPCDYPDQTDSVGRRCGGRAASRKGGGRLGP